MKTQLTIADNATLAKTLAPEDVRPGDYVAVLSEQFEYPAFAWRCDHSLANSDELIRVRLRPREAEGPLRVVAACLPFVFVKPLKGAGRTIDLRAVRLARLDRDYARLVRKTLSDKPKGKRRK